MLFEFAEHALDTGGVVMNDFLLAGNDIEPSGVPV